MAEIDGTSGDDTLNGTASDDTISGLDGNDSIDGGAGNDSLLGGAGNDTLNGGTGDDTLIGGTGDDSKSGGDGADVFLVTEIDGIDTITGGEGGTDSDTVSFGNDASTDGVTVTFTGDEAGTYAYDNAGASGSFTEIEAIEGTENADVVDASATTLGTNIDGGGGADSLTGGSGNDTLLGGAGDDTIDGGAGNDSIDGGDGNDSLLGGAGADTIDGGLGDDTIAGGTGNDSLSGGAGADTIDGGAGNDSIDGGDGNDSLLGGAGADTIDGGAGDDTLAGGTGNDSLRGGDGADVFLVTEIDGIDTITGGEGGTDSDTVSFGNDASTDGVTVTFTGDEAGTYAYDNAGASGSFTEIEAIEGTENADVVDASATTLGTNIDGGGGADSLTGGSGNDTLLGGAGDDTIDGGAGNDSIDGGDGNDSLLGGAGADTIDGGLGDDTIAGGTGNDSLSGGAGADTIDGGAGNDSIDGGDGNDSLLGGAGADTIDGGAGDDTLAGGTGNDSLRGGDGSDTFSIIENEGDDTVVGGEGGVDSDTLTFAGLTSGDGITVTFTGDEAGTFQTDNLGSTGIFSQIEVITGTKNEDLIDASGTTGGVTLAGGDQKDTLIGGSGADSIDGGDEDDSIDGGDGADTIDGGLKKDTISGGAGADVIYGGLDDDSITGGTGDDSLHGDGGKDEFVLTEDAGDDTIDGGLDDDRLKFGNTATIDGITVTITFDQSGTYAYDNFGATGSFTSIENVTGTENADLIDASGAIAKGEHFGGGGDDTIFGGSDNDKIDGGAGNDSLVGGSGNDDIDGGAGNDSLDGGAGNDKLTGGTGDDTMSGGDDKDKFHIGETSGTDVIIGGDGGDNYDTIDFDNAAIFGVSVTFTGDGSGTYSYGGGGASGTFTGIEEIRATDQGDTIDAGSTTLGVDLDGKKGADHLTGGSGDDVIHSKDDADTIFGGAGADTIDGGNDNDKIQGGEGDDSIKGGSGDDLLKGGAGDDILDGEGGADIYGFAKGYGSDTIVDWMPGEGDTINLHFPGINSFADVQALMTEVAGDTVMTFADGSVLTVQNATPASFTAAQFSFGNPPVCYAAGTLIDTPDGQKPVETLRPGDLVTTLDHGTQAIRYSHSDFRPLDPSEHKDKPILIKAGSLGRDMPATDLIVSPQHRILVGAGGQLEPCFGSEAFAPAKSLTLLPGIRSMKGKNSVTWVHFACERHEVVRANGAWSESLLLGPVVLLGMTPSERRSLFAIFGADQTQDAALNGPPARELMTVGAVRRLLKKTPKDKRTSVAKEIAKWDVDLAMEHYERNRLYEAELMAKSRNWKASA